MKKAEKLAKKIFSDDDLQEISEAIKTFESRTSGEIVISFNTTSNNQPYKSARRIFEKAKLHQTKERNATLIVLFLSEQKFAVYGDAGIHEKVPENFWESTVADMKTHFAQGRMRQGLLHGITQLGENLAKFFPVAADDVNELSDELKYGDDHE
ncbi:MAG: TPM domain-containing protein [Candidatus Marinimicrobia bacterium]|nr:TPM domain-containing protein [Candidatus Neomarinimicrobiota bacterium]